MAKVSFRIKGAPPKPWAHRKAILTDGHVRLAFPIWHPETDHDGFGGVWVSQDRPGRKPIEVRSGDRLRHARLEVTAVDAKHAEDRTGKVHITLGRLENFAATSLPLTVVNVPEMGGRKWRLTEFSYRAVDRLQGNNAILRAEITLDFTEVSNAVVAKRVVNRTPRTAKATPAAAPAGSGGGPRHHTVKAGETLSSISVHYYGTASRWPDIAWANHLSNPNRIFPGQVLVIP